MLLDKNGKEVKIGSKVKVLHIDSKVTEFLPEQEVSDIYSMINDVLEVYEISGNYASVEKIWDRGEGKTESHRVSVAGSDLELIAE